MQPRPTADGSLTLHSERYGQAFHSRHGAVSESRHVFLEASGVAARLRSHQPTRVLEVGFGTGLNCWLTADLAVQTGTALELISLEQELLPAEALRSLGYGAYLQHPEILERYFGAGGPQGIELAAGVSLSIRTGRAEAMELPAGWADAVYHDAFSPEVNAELWTADFLAKLRRSLKPGGVLVTYSVKGQVRRSLQELGLRVDRRPGPAGGKRQILVASSGGSD